VSEPQSNFTKVSLLIALFLFTVLIIAYSGLKKIESQTRSDIGKALNIVLKTTKESHKQWISDHSSVLEYIVQQPEVINTVKQLLNEPRTPDALLKSVSLEQLRHYFIPSRDQFDDRGFFIITKDYTNIGSMRDENLGIKNLIAQRYSELLERAFHGETIFIPPIHSDVYLEGKSKKNQSTMFFVTPIKDKEQIIALLSIRKSPDRDFTRLTQTGRIGDTGETYAFDQFGRMISNSRFNEQLQQIGLISAGDNAILNIQVKDPGGNLLQGFSPSTALSEQQLTVMAKSAIAGNTDINVQGYRDYRGETVLGAWLWDSDLKYGIATEIDEKEALKSYRLTKEIVGYIVTITILLSLILASIIYWIEHKSKAKLKQSHDSLESKVKERTTQLTLSNKELENTISQLRMLEEIIPICSYCKSIQNDSGSWDMLEEYFMDRKLTNFSHSICPDCKTKAYEEANLNKD